MDPTITLGSSKCTDSNYDMYIHVDFVVAVSNYVHLKVLCMFTL